MEQLVRLRVELSRLLESAAEARARGEDAQADEFVQEAMRLSEEVAALEQPDTAEKKGPAEAGPKGE
jgi:hypothetical protein